MKIKSIASNMTELVLNDGTQVLFSYQTPVACWADGQFYKTEKKWSVTTSKHINKWSHCAISKPQEYFDNLVQGGLIMSNNTYNGWTNYATWRVNLEMFDGMEFDHYPSDDELKEFAESIINEDATYNSLAHSYAMAFLSDVNWSEIASHCYYQEESEADND